MCSHAADRGRTGWLTGACILACTASWCVDRLHHDDYDCYVVVCWVYKLHTNSTQLDMQKHPHHTTPVPVITTACNGLPHAARARAARSSPNALANWLYCLNCALGENAGTLAIDATTSIPCSTLPNTTFSPSNDGCGPGPVLREEGGWGVEKEDRKREVEKKDGNKGGWEP